MTLTEVRPATAYHLRWGWDIVARDALSAGFSRRWAQLVFWSPLVGGLVVAASNAYKPFFYGLLREDRPVEWAQFAVCLFAGLAAGLASVRMARRGQRPAAALYLVFALAVIPLAGEEISWGQRAFALSGPAELESINSQGELTLHNIEAGSLSFEELSQNTEALAGCLVVTVILAVLTMTTGIEATNLDH